MRHGRCIRANTNYYHNWGVVFFCPDFGLDIELDQINNNENDYIDIDKN
jgi:hypothetical protein